MRARVLVWAGRVLLAAFLLQAMYAVVWPVTHIDQMHERGCWINYCRRDK